MAELAVFPLVFREAAFAAGFACFADVLAVAGDVFLRAGSPSALTEAAWEPAFAAGFRAARERGGSAVGSEALAAFVAELEAALEVLVVLVVDLVTFLFAIVSIQWHRVPAPSRA